MDSLQKFYSDAEKIKKHERASGSYSAGKVCEQIKELFERNNRSQGDLAASFSDYWLEEYINSSTDFENEPSDEHLDKLIAFQALLEMSQDERDTECLTKKDWKELCSLVNLEADELDLDLLNSLMTVFVSKGAL